MLSVKYKKLIIIALIELFAGSLLAELALIFGFTSFLWIPWLVYKTMPAYHNDTHPVVLYEPQL